MHPRNPQSGFTITELMITVALSMSVISSVLIGYMATYSSSLGTLAGSKLHQDMSALMNLMASDIRRAGYTGNITALASPADNPFSQVDDTALEVFDSMAGNNQQGPTGSGSCIVYAYDLDEDGVVDANELFGFRLNAGAVQMRTLGNVADPDTCASANNTWVSLTDPAFMTVTALTFNLAGSACLNTREPNEFDDDGDGTDDNAEEYDCYQAPLPTAGSGDITVETREVAITVSAQLANDSFVRMSLTETVRVRNDWVRSR